MTILNVCAIIVTAFYVVPKMFDFYLHRTKYSERGWFKKTLNWVFNGDFS